VVIALTDTWFSLYPKSDLVVHKWPNQSYYQMTPADMAELRLQGMEHLFIAAEAGDILIFKKLVVHGSVAVKAGDGTRFTTYAQFRLTKRPRHC
jgi:hypothetical protein